ncbi:hypothetical protein N7455_006186 [Penicillium solitum]|uniref:uncharacterized protein n=1 Tax=Penicillium solitum TaxID=60172 RepID=UPI0032C448FF|nr:hypothetical protein N7455_006186 [Penicillium solitum]
MSPITVLPLVTTSGRTTTTGDEIWLTRVNGLLTKTFDTFIHNNIISEVTCEPTKQCNVNEIMFKGLFSSWLAFTALLVPSTYDKIMPKLQSSVKRRRRILHRPRDRWYMSQYDGWTGMEEEIAMSNIYLANMIQFEGLAGPVTSRTGDNSTSNVNAGKVTKTRITRRRSRLLQVIYQTGAGLVTFIFVAGWAGGTAWIIIGV